MTLPVEHLDVFASAPGGGNPCPIVADASALSSGQMQALAAHYGQETGFVLRDDDGGLRLRYFVPRHEMSMCVHATVAAVTVLLDSGSLSGDRTVVRTAAGDCTVSWDDAPPPRVTVEQQAPEFGPVLDIADEVEPVAGLAAGAIDDRLPIRSVSVSRPKLIVPVRAAADLHAAVPDPERLWQLCRRHETTGAYLFAAHPDARPGHLVARQFPVDAGYPEDPATGVAAGALAAYRAECSRPNAPGWLSIDIDQGDAMGRPSRLRAAAFVDADGVRRSTVTGRAHSRRREELDLATVRPY